MAKLTKAREKALRFYLENDGAKFHPIGIAAITLDRLVEDGLLRREKPIFGFSRYYVTEAGRRAALSQAGDGR